MPGWCLWNKEKAGQLHGNTGLPSKHKPTSSCPAEMNSTPPPDFTILDGRECPGFETPKGLILDAILFAGWVKLGQKGSE
eukprot:205268-Pelagomonas_calceolata.AAC.1